MAPMPSRRGQILIASPQLRDPNFLRTLVLIVRDEEEGTLGLVLNRPLEVTVADACGQAIEAAAGVQLPLFHGGPCDGPLTVLHDSIAAGDEVLPGVRFSADREEIELLMSNSPPNVKYFAGYAGWSPQQLDAELAEGAWHRIPAEASHVFGQSKSLWSKLMTWIALGRSVGLDRIPDDPSLN
jgi:putative transcriptional regulator